jgi:hypothetical protein
MKTPPEIEKRITDTGGLNRFGEPLYRIIWGYERIVPITGFWFTGFDALGQPVQSDVPETRMEPKYMPADRWHLEMWRPPEEYGTPDTWRQQGLEVYGGYTCDTAGEFPSRGDYELILTFQLDNEYVPLNPTSCEAVVTLLKASRDFTYMQRLNAINQREMRKSKYRVNRMAEEMRNKLRPFAGESFIVVPGSKFASLRAMSGKEN